MADFSGVTFAKQNVTPADDGLVRRALLSDGILTGCNFSYSGYTLSMSAGALIVCGRQIRHPSAQNWAVVGAKSGYARLVLDIDLTKSSTKDLFEQVSTTLEYATDEAGFTELIQEDLNVSGSHYQIALCVVSLGEAGITGIVSQLDSAAGTGGNFSVVGGLTQPTSPKENMIWVKADVKKAPKYVFAVAAPESPSEGLIWFLATHAGIITKTYVYTSGAWKLVEASMYIGGKWVMVSSKFDGILYDAGARYDEWNASASVGAEVSRTPTLSAITRAEGGVGILYTENKVLIDGFTALHINGNTGGGGYKAYVTSEPPAAGKVSGVLASKLISYNSGGSGELDVSAISEGYVVLYCGPGGSSFTYNFNVSKVWLT